MKVLVVEDDLDQLDIAAPALAMAFRFILAPEAGFMSVVNHWWPGFWDPGLDGADAMASVIIAFSWKYVGYNFIFFLAAFQSIPRSLIEAGAMDGSGVLRRFKDIQFPLITPTIFFLLVINITESFQDSFGIVDIMTFVAGKPFDSIMNGGGANRRDTARRKRFPFLLQSLSHRKLLHLSSGQVSRGIRPVRSSAHRPPRGELAY